MGRHPCGMGPHRAPPERWVPCGRCKKKHLQMWQKFTTEKASFNDVEAWPASRVVRWVAELEGGRYEALASAFGGLSGKRLATEWRGTVVKFVRAQGGTEEDALAIYDAFHERLRQAKARNAKRTAPLPRTAQGAAAAPASEPAAAPAAAPAAPAAPAPAS